MIKLLDTKVTGVNIYQYGIFKGDIDDDFDTPTSERGTEHKVAITSFVEKTLQIPAILGKHFGIIYVVKGDPPGGVINIKMRILHPPIKNPQTNELFSFAESVYPINIGAHEFYGWIFEHEWELASGQYTFQILYNDKKLGEKTFTVYKPQLGRGLDLQ